MRIRITALVALLLWAAPAATAQEAGETASAGSALALLLRGDAEAAAAQFERVLSSDPTNVDAVAGRVRALIRVDRWQQALYEARAFQRAHQGPGASAVLGEALVRAGRLSEAQALLADCVSDDTPGRALATYARVLAATGAASEARLYANRAVAAAPEDRDVLLWASDIAAERSRTIELLGRYLDLAEGDDADRVAAATQTRAFLRSIGDRRFWVPGRRPERLEPPLRPVPGTGGPAGYTIEMTGAEGKKVRLLLDTGSTGLFLVERAARKLGLEALDTQTAFGGGGDRRHATTRGVLPTVAFGELRFQDALVSTTPRAIHPAGAYQGVISLAAFEGYLVTIDMAQRRLLLGPAPAIPGGQPYWTVANQWLVEAGCDEESGLFLLDTGAQGSVLAAAFAAGIDDARLGAPASAAGFGGAMSGARWAHNTRLRFQECSTPSRPMRVLDLSLRSRLGGVELAGFAGLDVLDGNRLILDTTRHRVVLETPTER